jgi:hypothetical protein
MSNVETRGIGDNVNVDQAKIVTNRLELDYAESVKRVHKLCDEALAQPDVVLSDQTALQLGALIKRIRDHDRKLEAFRVAEKDPYLRAEQGVDTFFFSLRDLLTRRNKNDRAVKPGAADDLQARIDRWQDEKAAKEKARLEAERQRAEREAAEEAAKLAAAQAEADEAARAASRARSYQKKNQLAELARDASDREADAKAAADLAAIRAEEARVATLAKPADLVRVRGNDANGGGVTLTAAREGYAILIDRNKLDLNAILPYLTDSELEKALRGFAKATGYVKQLPGAEIGFKNRGVTR